MKVGSLRFGLVLLSAMLLTSISAVAQDCNQQLTQCLNNVGATYAQCFNNCYDNQLMACYMTANSVFEACLRAHNITFPPIPHYPECEDPYRETIEHCNQGFNDCKMACDAARASSTAACYQEYYQCVNGGCPGFAASPGDLTIPGYILYSTGVPNSSVDIEYNKDGYGPYYTGAIGTDANGQFNIYYGLETIPMAGVYNFTQIRIASGGRWCPINTTVILRAP